jgi:hypothetical protein
MRTELHVEQDLFKAYRDGTLRAIVMWEDRYARYVSGLILTLLEWDKFANKLTGNKTEVKITYVLRADPHIDRDYVVLSVQ